MIQLTSDEAKRTLDLARRALADIGEIDHCEYRIAYAGKTLTGVRIPTLYLVFDYPEIADSGMSPALAVSLTNLATGGMHDADKLRRMIINSVERYLTAVGRPENGLKVDYKKVR